jgi:hypothetical protein
MHGGGKLEPWKIWKGDLNAECTEYAEKKKKEGEIISPLQVQEKNRRAEFKR